MILQIICLMNLHSETCIYHTAQTQFIKECYMYLILHENASLAEKNYSYTVLWASCIIFIIICVMTSICYCFPFSHWLNLIVRPSAPHSTSQIQQACRKADLLFIYLFFGFHRTNNPYSHPPAIHSSTTPSLYLFSTPN